MITRHWSRVCNLAAFSDQELLAVLHKMLPKAVAASPGYPRGIEHRKRFEEAFTYLAMKHFGAIRPDAQLISVAAGHEVVTYYLTNEVRWVFATDIYGDSEFAANEAVPEMLSHPENYANSEMGSWRPGRLVVEYMDALDLRAEDECFDGAYSLSSIEHMGGLAGAERAIQEMGRIVRPGGVVSVVTECVVNGAPRFESQGLSLFTPDDLRYLAHCCPLLEPVDEFSLAECDPLDGSVSPVLSLNEEIRRAQNGEPHTAPHILLHWEHGADQVFTSAFLVFRRVG